MDQVIQVALCERRHSRDLCNHLKGKGSLGLFSLPGKSPFFCGKNNSHFFKGHDPGPHCLFFFAQENRWVATVLVVGSYTFLAFGPFGKLYEICINLYHGTGKSEPIVDVLPLNMGDFCMNCPLPCWFRWRVEEWSIEPCHHGAPSNATLPGNKALLRAY